VEGYDKEVRNDRKKVREMKLKYNLEADKLEEDDIIGRSGKTFERRLQPMARHESSRKRKWYSTHEIGGSLAVPNNTKVLILIIFDLSKEIIIEINVLDYTIVVYIS